MASRAIIVSKPSPSRLSSSPPIYCLKTCPTASTHAPFFLFPATSIPRPPSESGASLVGCPPSSLFRFRAVACVPAPGSVGCRSSRRVFQAALARWASEMTPGGTSKGREGWREASEARECAWTEERSSTGEVMAVLVFEEGAEGGGRGTRGRARAKREASYGRTCELLRSLGFDRSVTDLELDRTISRNKALCHLISQLHRHGSQDLPQPPHPALLILSLLHLLP